MICRRVTSRCIATASRNFVANTMFLSSAAANNAETRSKRDIGAFQRATNCETMFVTSELDPIVELETWDLVCIFIILICAIFSVFINVIVIVIVPQTSRVFSKANPASFLNPREIGYALPANGLPEFAFVGRSNVGMYHMIQSVYFN